MTSNGQLRVKKLNSLVLTLNMLLEGGENDLKRTLRLVGPLLLIATIALLLVPAAHASTPWKVGGGSFDMSLPDQIDSWSKGNVIIMHYYGGGGYLYGTMEGKWIHDEWDVLNLDTGKIAMIGVWDTPEGVTVDGVAGTIHVLYWGIQDAVTFAFQGQWVILSGTGGLANLRGGGTMWADATGAYYTIKYRFGP
jgi:hypothetical protein